MSKFRKYIDSYYQTHMETFLFLCLKVFPSVPSCELMDVFTIQPPAQSLYCNQPGELHFFYSVYEYIFDLEQSYSNLK